MIFPLKYILGLLILCIDVLANSSARGRPNVIIVITDDQGYGDLACHGIPVLKTPNLESTACRVA